MRGHDRPQATMLTLVNPAVGMMLPHFDRLDRGQSRHGIAFQRVPRAFF